MFNIWPHAPVWDQRMISCGSLYILHYERVWASLLFSTIFDCLMVIKRSIVRRAIARGSRMTPSFLILLKTIHVMFSVICWSGWNWINLEIGSYHFIVLWSEGEPNHRLNFLLNSIGCAMRLKSDGFLLDGQLIFGSIFVMRVFIFKI